MGMKADPRGEQGIKKYLNLEKEKYQELKAEEKKYYDLEKLKNPYADSRIHVADNLNHPVVRALAGIDIDEGEVLLADRLTEKGKNIDLVIGHHPIGKVLADLHNVMDMLADMFADLGVPIHVAESIMDERIGLVSRTIHPVNHNQPVDMAQILKVNILNFHTPADNIVTNYLDKLMKNRKPNYVKDVLKIIKEIPEYEEGTKLNAGPVLISGKPTNHAGKVFIDMTGGTSPSEKIYYELSKAGVSTIVGMHMKEESIKSAKESHINIIIAGHMSSDSLGMNLILDELEKKGIEVIPCSGLIRIKRFKTKK